MKTLIRMLDPVFVVLLFSFATLRAAETTKTDDERPNVLFILADDLRPDGLGALGNTIVQTPNIDRIVERGFIFRNAYTLGSDVGAVCTPSRTMIQTGHSYFCTQRTTPTLAQTIKNAGYTSIRSGKHQNNPNALDADFDRHLDGKTAEGNANNIIAFIKEHAGKKPMFLYMAPNEPHDPQFAPDSYYPRYRATDIPLPVNFLPFHPFDNGQMTIRDERTLPQPRTKEGITGKLARYYASITYLDDQVGRVIAALKEASQFDNTLIIVAGDNGLSLGEHGLLGKQNLYEFGGMHVPLVFAGPGISKGESKSFAYLMDIYPTTCELTHIPVPSGLDSKSLVPVITGQAPQVRDVCYTSYRDCQRAVRDERWKMIRYPLVDQTQLFDLQIDPHEMNNLAEKEAYVAKVVEMTALLEKEMAHYGDTAPLKVANPQSPAWSPSLETKEKMRKLQ